MQPILKLGWVLDFLNLKENETETIMFGRPDLWDDFGTLGPLVSYNHSFVKNLGVIFNSSFFLSKFQWQLG